MLDLYNKLLEYNNSNKYPFHMPGHKRNMDSGVCEGIYKIDITEIEGFDNLNAPEGIIKEAMEEASKVFQAESSYFLVNGSTCGILSSISSVANDGDKIAVARSSHKAVYNAIEIKGLRASYLYPEYIDEFEISGSISPEQVEDLLKREGDIKAVVITSPTMQGVVSDVRSIARICHDRNVVLIVDEAHGAHFGFAEGYPKNSNQNGADIVIQSLHKTLPSPTQTAIMHVNGKLVDIKKVEHWLSIYQTSSPSYILLAGIFKCIELVENENVTRLNRLREYHKMFVNADKNMKNISIFTTEKIPKSKCYDFDIGKIIIRCYKRGFTGKQFYDILLNKYDIQLEMCDATYGLAILTGYDSESGVRRLIEALFEIDKILEDYEDDTGIEKNQALLLSCLSNTKLTIREAMESESIVIDVVDAAGRISAGYLMVYPPGVPILAPGEIVTEEIIEWIGSSREIGLNIQGLLEDNTKLHIVY